MYRVLAVDDEPAVLEGLHLLVPWEQTGFSICGEAQDGRDALLRMEALRPQLVITDIRMPFAGGIDLIREARRLGYDTEFIILSGYADFQYARQAIEQGVHDYLVKPLDTGELLAALAAVRKDIDARFYQRYGFLTNELAERTSSGRPVGALSPKETPEQRMLDSLRLLSFADTCAVVEELFADLQSRGASPDKVSIAVYSIVHEILRFLHERNIRLSLTLPPDAFSGAIPEQSKLHLLSVIKKAIEQLAQERKKHARAFLHTVKEHIDSHYAQEIAVAALAELVFVDPAYLGAAFHKLFGQSIGEYLHAVRIDHAVEMMRTGDRKLQEVAAAVGYNNYNNFFSHFERRMRCKPTEFLLRNGS